MNKDRLDRLESVVKQMVGEMLLENIQEIEESFGLINIVGVKISPDISYLDVFVSSFKSSDILTKTLAVYAPKINRQMHKKLSLRKLPKIRFRYDESGEISQEIIKTINSL